MSNKLTYTNYNGCKDIIAIDLHNDYTIIAIKSYNTDDHAYTVEFHLKEKTTDMWQLIQDATTTFNTDHKSINGAILKHVATLFADEFYDYFIERYEYDLKCFDIGNDVLSESNKCICPACKQDMHERLDICPYCETHISYGETMSNVESVRL